MTAFTYSITLIDRHGARTSLGFNLGDFSSGTPGEDFELALGAANQIRGALVAITLANVNKESLTHVVSEDDQIPANAADVTDEAVINVHLNAPTAAKKLAVLRVPAPVDGMFTTDLVTLDPLDADTVQFVQQVSQHAYISDGEQINTASGQYANGIASGYKRSKARRLG